MKTSGTSRGFTLIELLVVIGIIALLASIALPAFTGVQIRAAQTKALSNAKQIGLACKQYAIDNNGAYPSYATASGSGTPIQVTDSNTAFDQLIPAYLSTIQCFYQPKSAFTPTATTDPNFATNPPTGTYPQYLVAKTNHWAYVTGLYDTSNSTFPLIADGFNSAANHTYTITENDYGGLWKGQQAIVIRCDDSGTVVKLNATYSVPGGPAGNDLFATGNGWLAASSGAGNNGNTTVNPLQ